MNPSNYMQFRDLQYEQDNKAYDEQYPEGGIKCKNYELCQHVLAPDWYINLANYLCMTCGSWCKMNGFGWDELEFREPEEECPVCNEVVHKQVKFPTNCGHWVCVSCARNILFWDETRYHLSPVPFGCPPCPNGCENPIRGRQCYCDEYYDEVMEKWRQDYPDKFEEYNNAEILSIEIGETNPGSVFYSRKCPLCRSKYERA